MVKKRAAVAAPLHAELTEYANLIRALRTSRTLDLTTHLLQDAAQQGQSQGSNKAAARDTWTRWPLPDFPIPEWRLDDEEDSIADGQGDASDPEADDLHPPITQLLVAHIGALLAHVLIALADLRPATVASMQNRLSPLNWQDVVNALAAQGVVDQAVISRAARTPEEYLWRTIRHLGLSKECVCWPPAKANYTALTSAYDDILSRM
ncbi:hypothetical protein EDD16DRAFT_1707661 [Pisolithus croceorrhizus]|nr:hypothetical protein EDD16DRAFT_1707661 [Pisolithus croceorrhizus]